ncbi:MAG: SDR family NAD(P)-dependent oxidoreductase, partial [Gammaproteobacteria bacterium]|nr:SDR family NAD(P)-dependent oxidoreductase [Gammaproteobacteria bacterium]
MELAGKTAFITGGASGLGLAVARNFVAAGASVALFDRNRELLDQAAAELGGQALCRDGDVTDEDSVGAAIAATRERFGAIHINVNSAGIGGAARTV